MHRSLLLVAYPLLFPQGEVIASFDATGLFDAADRERKHVKMRMPGTPPRGADWTTRVGRVKARQLMLKTSFEVRSFHRSISLLLQNAHV